MSTEWKFPSPADSLGPPDPPRVPSPRPPVRTARFTPRRIQIRMARAFWALAIPIVILAPLLLSPAAGGGGDLVVELALATGLLAASLLVIVVVSASRMRSITIAFGIERVLLSHRYLGLLAMIIVLVHTGLILLDNPHNYYLLLFVHAPPRARAATGSTIAIVLLCLASEFKRKLHLPYEVWRWTHIILATIVVVLGALHVYWLNHLIRDPVMRAVFIVMAVVMLAVVAKRWILRPLFSRHRNYRIEEVRIEGPAVYTLVLKPLYAWQRGMRFAPGQFAWIRLTDSSRSWEDHPFTIASGAHRPRQLEFTIRYAGDFTKRLGELKPGRTVQVDGPYGSFSVDYRPSRGLLLIAGGVGLTPMMSILRTLDHRGDQRPATLLVGARHVTDLLFRAEIEVLAQRMPLRVLETLSDPP